MEESIEEVTEEHIPNAIRIILGSILMLLVLSVLLGFRIAKGISTPIAALQSAALKVGEGKMDIKVDLDTTDEVGVLAAAFNRMVADLKQTTVSKTFLNSIIESMSDPLIVTNPDLTVKRVNSAFCRLFGCDRQEIKNSPLNETIGLTDMDTTLFDELRLKHSLKNIELTCTAENGKQVPILFSATALVQGNRVHSIVCALRDITERKAAERTLQASHDELEQQVAHRTRDLVQTAGRLKEELAEHRKTTLALKTSEAKLRQLSYNVLRAQEDERKRIANELHDELGQSLSLLKVQMGSIERKLTPEQTALAQELKSARQHLNLVIEEVRRLSKDLSPAVLDDLGLTAALKKIGKDFSTHYNKPVTFEAEPVDDLFSRDTRIMVYRIFQEIFTNIAKHANCRHCVVHPSAFRKKMW